ncbi:MAG: PQQ-dependent sugar dehydrogenase [Burkholderiales bacterium]|jgi:glucose/arabinose dehydrogenase|nr:PQQ-dependent sugar dehydrogenase [Burkholderiales bacterium]
MSRCFAVAFVGLLAASPVSFAQSPSTAPIQTREHAVRLVTLTEGLERPWGLAFLPDGRMLVTEKAGRLRVVGKDGKLDSTPVAGLPRVDAQGQGGLLDVALHPDYAANGWVYWTYSQRDAEGRNGTELARGKLAGTPGAQRMEQVEVLFRMAAKTDRSHHFGSRIVFDAKQGQPVTLYVTLGDRGEMQRAQALDDHAGKILRLTDDGKPAPGNPFLNDPKARAEIFSLGNRNVQGAALHPQTGVLWAHEHGPQGGDELNVIKAGTNYGWPVITYGVNYVTGTKIGEGTTKAGMAQPVKHWPSGFSPSGMAFYTGERFPKWRGDVLMGALRGQGVMRVRLDGERAIDEEMMLTGSIGRVRDVRVGPDGLVYLLTDLPNGGIVRIEPVQ